MSALMPRRPALDVEAIGLGHLLLASGSPERRGKDTLIRGALGLDSSQPFPQCRRHPLGGKHYEEYDDQQH